jgi:hypothetical protein
MENDAVLFVELSNEIAEFRTEDASSGRCSGATT